VKIAELGYMYKEILRYYHPLNPPQKGGQLSKIIDLRITIYQVVYAEYKCDLRGMGEMTRQEYVDFELKRIGKKLQYIRIQAGYPTATAFARAHQIPASSYNRYEKGANLTMLQLMRILDKYEMDIKEFMLMKIE